MIISEMKNYQKISKDTIYIKGPFVVALIYTVYSNSKFSNKEIVRFSTLNYNKF